MSVIDRIKSIAKKLNVKVSGETIVELLDSLESGLDAKVTIKPTPVAATREIPKETTSVVNTVREAYTPKKNKKNRRTENEDDE